jgi:hypothetical protein
LASLTIANSSLRDFTCSSSDAAAASSFGIVALFCLDVFDESAMTMRERKMRKSETIDEKLQLGSWTTDRQRQFLPRSGEMRFLNLSYFFIR